MVKLVSGSAAVLATVAVAGTSTAAAETAAWADAFGPMNSCMRYMGTCKRSDGKPAAPWSEAACELAGLDWEPKFAKWEDAAAASEAALARIEASSLGRGIFLALGAVDALPAGVSVLDTVSCTFEREHVSLTLLEATPAAATAVSGIVGALPGAAKVHGVSAKNAGVVLRAAPGAGSAAQLASAIKSANDGRRRLSGAKAFSVRASQGGDVVVTGADDDDLAWLAEQPGVLSLDPVIKHVLFNEAAAKTTQSGFPLTGTTPETPIYAMGLSGDGEVVTVVDSGLATGHCLFDDSANPIVRSAISIGSSVSFTSHRKVVHFFAFTDRDPQEPNGDPDHGTHVAGSVAGSLEIGDDANKGMAHGAKLAFVDIGYDARDQDGRPTVGLDVPTLTDMLFTPSHDDAGSAIFTNSWGSDENSYSPSARNIDAFLFNNQESVVLFAAGNAGFIPGGSISDNANGKNVIVVGATPNGDGSSGLVNTGPNLPEEIAEIVNPDNVAFFSSNGPAADGRIRPDVVAPGFFVTSADSRTTCEVTRQAGTSMATPVTAGNVALMREYLRKGFYPSGTATEADAFTPMGALLKAMLINSAVDISSPGNSITSGSYGFARVAPAPDNFQGFGRPQLDTILRGVGSSSGPALFLHGDMAAMPTLTAQNTAVDYKFNVSDGTDGLKVTLVWYDKEPRSFLASTVLVNDLDLEVSIGGRSAIFPNNRQSRDELNTVEQIVVPASSLQTGDEVTVTVKARVILTAQPFALVVNGNFDFASANVSSAYPIPELPEPPGEPTNAPTESLAATSFPALGLATVLLAAASMLS